MNNAMLDPAEQLTRFGFESLGSGIYRKQNVVWSGGAFRVFDSELNACDGAETDRAINANETSDDDAIEYQGLVMHVDPGEQLEEFLESMAMVFDQSP